MNEAISAVSFAKKHRLAMWMRGGEHVVLNDHTQTGAVAA